jgi:hypothetical protein
MATFEEAVNAQQAAAKKFRRFGEIMGIGVIRWRDGGFGLKINFRDEPCPQPTQNELKVHGVPAEIDVVGTIQAFTVF